MFKTSQAFYTNTQRDVINSVTDDALHAGHLSNAASVHRRHKFGRPAAAVFSPHFAVNWIQICAVG